MRALTSALVERGRSWIRSFIGMLKHRGGAPNALDAKPARKRRGHSPRGLTALALAGGTILCGRAASATDHLSGIVLMTPSAQSIVVHHSAFGGMPAMTMTFRVPTGSALHAGDRISADVDRSGDPWTLSHIRTVGSEFPAAQSADKPFLRPGDRVPGIAFVDQRGRELSLAQLAGRPYALTFMYTRCADPSMCPLVSAKLRVVQNQSKPPISLVEVSLDPAYDRPPVLARYAARYGADPARWHTVTGDPRSVLDFAARFGILEHSAGPVTIVHSERLAIVAPDGRIARLFDNAAWSPRDVLQSLDQQFARRGGRG